MEYFLTIFLGILTGILLFSQCILLVNTKTSISKYIIITALSFSFGVWFSLKNREKDFLSLWIILLLINIPATILAYKSREKYPYLKDESNETLARISKYIHDTPQRKAFKLTEEEIKTNFPNVLLFIIKKHNVYPSTAIDIIFAEKMLYISKTNGLSMEEKTSLRCDYNSVIDALVQSKVYTKEEGQKQKNNFPSEVSI